MNPTTESEDCLRRARGLLETLTVSSRYPYFVVADAYEACYRAAIGVLAIARDDTFKAHRIRERFAEIVAGSPFFSPDLIRVLEDLAHYSADLEYDIEKASKVTVEEANETAQKAIAFVRATEAWIKTHPNYKIAA